MSRALLPAATRRENQELKTDAPSGHGLAAALGVQGAGKGGDTSGYHVWQMIRKSDGRTKHTFSMFGVTLSGRDAHASLTDQGERTRDDCQILPSGAVLLVC